MDVLKCLLAAREEKSPQVRYRQSQCCVAELLPCSNHQVANQCVQHLHVVCTQVQALLNCLEDSSFNLQVCICSVGACLFLTVAASADLS
jgi:hypothetical protein